MIQGYAIRTMGRADLDIAIGWAAAEGWNPGLRDAEAFFAADLEGYLMGELNGEPVACISVVRYGEDFAFLGLYICRPEFRRRGLGYAIWQAGMARLGGRSVGLDGVVEQQPNYRKSGFTLVQRNIRFGAERPVAPAVPAGVTVQPAAALPFAAIASYDRSCFPAPRDAFLRPWLTLPGHVALAAMRGGTLAGYAVLRPCLEGSKIGPLFADDVEAAQALLAALLPHAPTGPVFLDVPEPHEAAMAMARAAGMAPVFETARMYTRDPPRSRAERVFGITSFELG